MDRVEHVIRLRGPWEYRLIGTADELARLATAGLASDGRLRLPGERDKLRAAGWSGPVQYRRNFHPPTDVEPPYEVWLVVEACSAAARVSLNGVELGWVGALDQGADFCVEGRLKSLNQLQIDVAAPGVWLGGVRLEIRRHTPPATDVSSTN